MCVCVMALQLDVFLHSSLIPDSIFGFNPPYRYDTTVDLGWMMCHGLKLQDCHDKNSFNVMPVHEVRFSGQVTRI